MVRKILLLGKNGQLGWELQRALAPLGEVLALGSKDQGGNLNDLLGLEKKLHDYQPHIIINAAAYTAVDKAESEQIQARQINETAVGFLAAEAKRLNSWFIHYSTDYVFDGTGNEPWLETDTTNPLNIYGATKRAGEQEIARIDGHYLILRTSWVYGCYGNNFIKTMLRLGKEREHLSIINDQIGTPTGAELLADITAQLIPKLNSAHKGIYHVTASGETSWYEFARYIFAQVSVSIKAELKVQQIEPILTQAYPTPAMRPLNSRLATDKLTNTFQLVLPHWQLGVKRVLTELLAANNR